MHLKAPAKINLTLEVTGVDQSGYHTLDTIFAWLQLHDSIEIEASSTTSLQVVADGASIKLVTSDESNLVLKALRAIEAKVGRQLPTHILLTKRIPSGGGLGGGSADAAAMLMGLNQLYSLNLTQQELEEIARRLGADVAFGLVGGMARGRGRGDLLEPIAPPEDLLARELVLLAPDFACPTAQVYKLWDEKPASFAKGASNKFLSAVHPNRLKHLKNDLQPAAERLHPKLLELSQRMRDVGLEAVTLSGSGSTLFGFVPLQQNISLIKESLEGLGRLFFTRLRKEAGHE